MKKARTTLAHGVVASLVTAGLAMASPGLSVADPNAEAPAKVVAYPGMAIVQGDSRCTLGYVDPIGRTGLTAGHCDTAGSVTDLHGNVIGTVSITSRTLPAGGTIGPADAVSDYEGIDFVPEVELSDMLPDGTRLRAASGGAPAPGQPVCLMGSVSGESCGKVDAINNGWFTMTDIAGQHGDSGGPVYSVTQAGDALLVGIYSLRWGGQPAAMSWSSISAQLQSHRGPRTPMPGPVGVGPAVPVGGAAPAFS